MITLNEFVLSDDERSNLAPPILDDLVIDYFFEIDAGKEEKNIDDQEKEEYRNIISVLDKEPFFQGEWKFGDEGRGWFHINFGFLEKNVKRQSILNNLEKINEVALSFGIYGFKPIICGQTFYLYKNDFIFEQNEDKYDKRELLFQLNSMAECTLQSIKFGNLAHSYTLDQIKSNYREYQKQLNDLQNIDLKSTNVLIPASQLSDNTISYQFNHVDNDIFNKLISWLKQEWPIKKYNLIAIDKMIAEIVTDDFPEKAVTQLFGDSDLGPQSVSKRFPGPKGLCINMYSHLKEIIPLLGYNSVNYPYKTLPIPEESPFLHLNRFVINYSSK